MTNGNPKDEIAALNSLLISLKDETSLLLDHHILSDSDGDDEIIIAQAYIRINQKKIDSMSGIEIAPNHLDELFKNSSGLRAKDTDVLGLKICYGADATDKMIYLYQPVGLIIKDIGDDAYMQKQGVFEVKDGPVYEYTNVGGFNSTFSTDHRTVYHQKAEVVHVKKDGFKRITVGTDVTAAIFTFQEIFALLHDNYPRQNLSIFNSIRRVKYNDKPYMLHALVLASYNNKPKAEEAFRPFTGAYANLAHLCPPNCSRLIYPLEA